MTRYKEEFEYREVPYTDKKLDVEIKLYVKGVMEFELEDTSKGVKDTIADFIVLTINLLGNEGKSYEEICYQDICPVVRERLDGLEELDKTLEIKNIYLTEVHPLDEDYPRIIAAKKMLAQKKGPEAVNNAASYTQTKEMPLNGVQSDEVTADLWFCMKCGNWARGNFCPKCGTAKSTEDVKTETGKTFCGKCGFDLTGRESVRFCPSCGAEQNADTVRINAPRESNKNADEQIIIKGACNWVVNPVLVQNGNGILTNKRFIYQKGSLIFNPLIGQAVTKAVRGKTNFEIPVESITKLKKGRQGLSQTIILGTPDGEYICCFPFGGYEKFWNAFNELLNTTV